MKSFKALKTQLHLHESHVGWTQKKVKSIVNQT